MMTIAKKIERMQILLDHDPKATDSECRECLSIAKDKIMSVRFPFGYHEDTEFPSQYDGEEVELACRYFARRGGLGETNHTENGVSRTWGSVEDKDILARITPICKVV